MVSDHDKSKTCLRCHTLPLAYVATALNLGKSSGVNATLQAKKYEVHYKLCLPCKALQGMHIGSTNTLLHGLVHSQARYMTNFNLSCLFSSPLRYPAGILHQIMENVKLISG